MKKTSLLVMMISILFLIAGCSSEEKKKVAVNAETKPYLASYDKQAMNFIHSSNQLLVSFNRGVDGLYTKEMSVNQFGQLLKQTIPKSQSLIEELETAEVDTNLLNIHQELIALGNHQHQLFLDAIEMANNNEVKKDDLREEYLLIKSEQSKFLTQWKETTKQLESGEPKKK